MNILFVTGEYPPLEGGVGAYTAVLAAALVEQGAAVSVITSVKAADQTALTGVGSAQSSGEFFGKGSATHRPQQFYVPDNSMAGASHSLCQKTELHPTGVQVLPIISQWGGQIWSTIQRTATEIGADWIHIQYQTAAYAMNPAINFAPWLWRHNLPGRVAGRPPKIAWTYHDLLIPYLFPKAGDRLRHWVTARPAHTSDLVIVTNEGDHLQLAAQGVTAASIPIGSNITGNMMTSDDRQMRRRKRNFAHDDVVIGYFGFLNRSKGAATAVLTLQRLVQQRCKAHLLMIGDVAGASDPTNHAYFLEIEQMIIDLGLVDRVRWTGRETDGEVSADLNACDLLLLPYEDGASLRRGTLMAGLANGCAILTTTPQAALPELLDGRDLLYFAPGDDATAAQLVLQLMRDRSVVATLRSNAFERSKLFTWQTIAARHMQEYQRR